MSLPHPVRVDPDFRNWAKETELSMPKFTRKLTEQKPIIDKLISDKTFEKEVCRMFGRGKKGSGFFDNLLLILIPACIFGMFLLLYFVNDNVSSRYTNALSSVPGIDAATVTQTNTIITNNNAKLPAFLDFFIVLCIFVLFISTIIVSYKLGNDSAFLILYIILSVAMLFVSFFFSSVLAFVFNINIIYQWASSFPMSMWIMEHMFILSIFFILANGVAIYVKPKQGGVPQ